MPLPRGIRRFGLLVVLVTGCSVDPIAIPDGGVLPGDASLAPDQLSPAAEVARPSVVDGATGPASLTDASLAIDTSDAGELGPLPMADAAPLPADAALSPDMPIAVAADAAVLDVPVASPDAEEHPDTTTVASPDTALPPPDAPAAPPPDTAAPPPPDAAPPTPDVAEPPPPDAGAPTPDAAEPPPDTTVTPPDTMPPASDAGAPDRSGCETGSCLPVAEWISIATGTVNASSMVVGANQQLVVAGMYSESAVLFGRPMTNPMSSSESFLTEVGAGGASWIRMVTGESNEPISTLVRNTSGEHVYGGGFSYSVSNGGTPHHGSGGYLASNGPVGEYRWLLPIEGGTLSVLAVGLDDAGNIYLLGQCRDSVRISGTSYPMPGSYLFVASLSPSLQVRWLHPMGKSFVPQIFVRGVDDVIVVGSYEELSFGGQVIKTKTFWDLFVTRLGPGGSPMWIRTLSGPTAVVRGSFYSLAVDSGGGIYVSGNMLDPGGAEVTVMAMDAAGNHRWSWRNGDIGRRPRGSLVAVGPDDSIVITTSVDGPATFGGHHFERSFGAYVMRAHNDDGSLAWLFDLGASEIYASALVAAPGGRLGILGRAINTANLGGLPLRPDGQLVPGIRDATYVLSLRQQ